MRRYGFAGIAFGALVLVACENTGLGTVPSALSVLTNSVLHPASVTAPSYSWQPYTAAPDVNTIVTDISNNKHSLHLVGVSYPNTGSSYSSFTALLPSSTSSDPTPSAGPPMDDPPGNKPPDVYFSAVNDTLNGANVYSAGYLTSGKSNNCDSTGVVTCGFIYDPSKKTSEAETRLVDRNEGKGQCAQTYLFGTMDANIQVGYYTTGPASGPCVKHAVEEYTYSTGNNPSGPQWIDFQFPSYITNEFGSITGSWAYGINNYGHVVGGFTAGTSSLVIGWEFKDFKYIPLQYGVTSGHAYATQPQDVGWDGSVVGWYLDGSNKSHGFLLFKGTAWTPENYNNNSSTQTAVYGFDDCDYMVGTYKSGSYWNGFIATRDAPCITNLTTTQRKIGSPIQPRR